MKKNGFTLIELLGVIIVLSVIALITVPMVLDVVYEARIQANTATAYGYLEAAKLYKAESIFDEVKQLDIDYINNIYSKITVKGTKPEEGQLYINSEGEDALAVMLDGKCYYKEFYKELTIKEDGECTLGWVGIDEETPTLTAKEDEIVIEVGTNADVTSYFNEPIFGSSGGTLSCDIEDTSLLEAGEHIITCTAQGTNGKTTVATKTITVDYRQLVNYTMLYDGSLGDSELNQMKDITGGWNWTNLWNLAVTVTFNDNSIYLNAPLYGSNTALAILSENNTINVTGYNNHFIIFDSSRYIESDSYGTGLYWTANQYSTDGSGPLFSSNIGTATKKIIISEILEPSIGYHTLSTYCGTTVIYYLGILKADNWNKLSEIANITTSTSLEEFFSDSDKINSILSNELAVNYMLKQCTGNFMATAIASEKFLSALESSPYKDMIYANEHWAKFLNM